MGKVGSWSTYAERAGAWLLATNIWVAGGLAMCLEGSAHVLGVTVGLRTVALAFTSTLFVYNLDHLRDSKTVSVGGRRASGASIALILVLAGLASTALLFAASYRVKVVCAAYAGLGAAYGATMGGFQLKRVAGLKSWLVATSSAIAGSGLVVADSGRGLDGDVVLVVVVAFSMIGVNAHLCDILDYGEDRTSRVRTLPVLIGLPAMRRLLRSILVGCAIFVAVGGWLGAFSAHPEIEIFLAINYVLTYVVRPEMPGVWGYLLVDGTLYLVPLAAVAHRVLARA